MTDIQEQTPAASATSGGKSAQGATAGPARAKRASLSTMLLPELQQLASGLGISTTKVKKSDLVAAIKAAQAGGNAPAAANANKAEAPPRRARSTSKAASEKTSTEKTATRPTGSDATPAGFSTQPVNGSERPDTQSDRDERRPDQNGGQRGNREQNRDREPNRRIADREAEP